MKKINSWKIIFFISFKNRLQISSFYEHEKSFQKKRNISQILKPIILERASYCIQFEIGTKTVKILKFNKILQASEQIIIDLSE